MVIDESIVTLLNATIEETINNLPWIIQVFHNPSYDLKKIVTNETDFLLGAVCSQIINQFSFSFYNRFNRRSTLEESLYTNETIFKRASELKERIVSNTGL